MSLKLLKLTSDARIYGSRNDSKVPKVAYHFHVINVSFGRFSDNYIFSDHYLQTVRLLAGNSKILSTYGKNLQVTIYGIT